MKPESRRVTVEPVRVSRNGKRFFSDAYKLAVVQKCLAPGASISAVALAHGFNANLVRKWITKYQRQQALTGARGTLVPVQVLAAPAATRPSKRGRDKGLANAASGWIEIELDGARVIVRGEVEAEQLHVVFNALGRWR